MLIMRNLFLLLFVGSLFTGSTLQAQDETPNVSDEELKTFAATIQGIQQINQEAQLSMIEKIENEGMNVERFNEIQMANQDPSSEVEVEEAEMKQYEKVSTEIQEIQMNTQKQMQGFIAEKGWTMERYQEILQLVQSDPDQLERLQKLMEG